MPMCHRSGDAARATSWATLRHNAGAQCHAIVQELCESRGGRPGLSGRPNEPSGFCGRKDLLHRASALVTTCP